MPLQAPPRIKLWLVHRMNHDHPFRFLNFGSLLLLFDSKKTEQFLAFCIMNRLVQKRFKGASQMKKPSEIKQLFKGYSFILACRGFVEYIFSESKGSNDAEIGGVAKDFLKWCEHTEHPDEHFFNTLNHQSHLNIPGSYLGILQSMLFSFQVIHSSQNCFDVI